MGSPPLCRENLERKGHLLMVHTEATEERPPLKRDHNTLREVGYIHTSSAHPSLCFFQKQMRPNPAYGHGTDRVDLVQRFSVKFFHPTHAGPQQASCLLLSVGRVCASRRGTSCHCRQLVACVATCCKVSAPIRPQQVVFCCLVDDGVQYDVLHTTSCPLLCVR